MAQPAGIKFDLLDPVNLEANRRGVLSSAQKGYVATLSGFSGCMITSVGAIALFDVLFALGFAVFAIIRPSANTPIFLGVGVFMLAIGVMIAYRALPALNRANAVRRDLSRGKAGTGDGEIIFENGKYRARLNGQLIALDPARQNLIPGRYRLYYLPESQWIVAAEPLDPQPLAEEANQDAIADVEGSPSEAFSDELPQKSVAPGPTPTVAKPISARGENPDAALLALQRLDQEALWHNRSGEMTAFQKAGLRRYAIGSLLLGMAVLFVGVIIGSLSLRGASGGGGTYLIGLVVAVSFTLTGFYLNYRGSLALTDSTTGRLSSFAGVAALSRSAEDRSAADTITLVDAEGRKANYRVSEAVHNSILEGHPYRAYFAPRSGSFVAIEPVPML